MLEKLSCLYFYEEQLLFAAETVVLGFWGISKTVNGSLSKKQKVETMLNFLHLK
ncbi:hypothetical protein [Neisseria iguanae]|uniref:hypothetical protein n=1 Tax=Neisseria iguanae TaxID=90242 RepID=UPI001475AF32|nr:hypothetical protein [Neisseria iguanae]